MLKESAQFKSLSENVSFNRTAKQMEIPELKQHREPLPPVYGIHLC